MTARRGGPATPTPRAAPVAVRVAGAPCGPGEFAMPSASTPGEAWAVFWRTADTCFCPCPGFAHRRTCRHVAAVALAVEIEARDAVAAATPESRAAAARRLAEIEEVFAP